MNTIELSQWTSLSTATKNQTYLISVKREGSDDMAVFMSNYLHDHLNRETKFEANATNQQVTSSLRQAKHLFVLIFLVVLVTQCKAMAWTIRKTKLRQPVHYFARFVQHHRQPFFKKPCNTG